MIFTYVSRLLAVLMVFFGLSRIGMAIWIVNSSDPVGAAAKYLGRDSTGQAIDESIELIFIGLVLGVLTDISISLSARRGMS